MGLSAVIRSALAILAACLLVLFAQARPGPDSNYNVAVSGGTSPASFTFGASAGSSGVQAISPYTVSGTFNTGATDLAIVALTNPNDFGSGVVTSVSVGATTLTCTQGTNNAAEQAWLCYGQPGVTTTATISVAFTGTTILNISTGKVTTTTPTPYSTGTSTGSQGGGVAVPFSVAPTTGSGGVPTNGVGVGIVGDFFASARTFTSVTPNQDDIINSMTGNGENSAFGHTTTVGASSGITVNASASIFPSWAIVSWSP